jgi:predicted outer membrane protein
MRIRRMLWGVGMVAVLGTGAGCAHSAADRAENQGERVGEAFAEKVRFADQLALFDQKQIALGHVALERSSNPEVRRFAQILIRDHQNHLEDLKTLAQSNAFSLALVDLSTQDSAIGGSGFEGAVKGAQKGDKAYDKKTDKQVKKFIEERDELASLRGREFDQEFLDRVKDDQKNGLDLVEEGLDDYRQDTSFALLLSRTTPILQGHQLQIRTLDGIIGD